MNKSQKIAMIIGAALGVTVLVMVLFQKGIFNGDAGMGSDGAEIPVVEGQVSFACDCGCMAKNKDGICRCSDCGMEEDKDKEEMPSVKEEEIYVFPAVDEGHEDTIIKSSDLHVKPMSETEAKTLTDHIRNSDYFSIRRCEALIFDDRVNDPKFTAVAESRYLYSKEDGCVYNAAGEDITKKLGFSVSSCKDGYDFLKQYFKYRGMPYDFMTEDTSHKRALIFNQRVYSFDVEECKELMKLKDDMLDDIPTLTVTEEDCSYTVVKYKDGVERILYITLMARGTDADDNVYIKYVTYDLGYSKNWG